MNQMARRLTMWGAVLIAGVVSGVTLGNFVAGSGKTSGADELASYFSKAQNTDTSSDAVREGGPITHSGPSSYECVGCDAGLHKVPDISEPAEYLPLPPYEAIDLVPTVYPEDEIPLRRPPRRFPGEDDPVSPDLRGREALPPIPPVPAPSVVQAPSPAAPE